jgi:ribosomal protein S28E/S33
MSIAQISGDKGEISTALQCRVLMGKECSRSIIANDGFLKLPHDISAMA